ncbi:MAG: cystathionine beta-lyase [Desulfobacterales bacterium]|nr:cystathionine beta-lyase [Desulfobacterales bacterium]
MKDDTALVHLGRDPEAHNGIVNIPVHHASTVIFPTIDDYKKSGSGRAKYHGIRYGVNGTPNSFALAAAVAQLEGGRGAAVVGSGLAAVTMALTSVLKSGDHLLMVDSVYGPTRRFCDTQLPKWGVDVTYYDPLIGGAISTLIKPATRLIFTESPGSLTFEIQDIPAIVGAAHKKDVLVMMDNTWATPLFFKPFAHGVDISIQAGTKYISGSSDQVIGIITARTEALFKQIKDTTMVFGEIASPDECYLALRGMRSMGVRLRQQQKAAFEITRWLQSRPELKRILYPALPEDPGHRLWQRDFLGASSLFGVILQTTSEKTVAHMVDNYRYFKIGASWGGYESLVIPANPKPIRKAVPWTEEGYLLRYHVGLEDTDDLIADLKAGFERLNS